MKGVYLGNIGTVRECRELYDSLLWQLSSPSTR